MRTTSVHGTPPSMVRLVLVIGLVLVISSPRKFQTQVWRLKASYKNHMEPGDPHGPDWKTRKSSTTPSRFQVPCRSLPGRTSPLPPTLASCPPTDQAGRDARRQQGPLQPTAPRSARSKLLQELWPWRHENAGRRVRPFSNGRPRGLSGWGLEPAGGFDLMKFANLPTKVEEPDCATIPVGYPGFSGSYMIRPLHLPLFVPMRKSRGNRVFDCTWNTRRLCGVHVPSNLQLVGHKLPTA